MAAEEWGTEALRQKVVVCDTGTGVRGRACLHLAGAETYTLPPLLPAHGWHQGWHQGWHARRCPKLSPYSFSGPPLMLPSQCRLLRTCAPAPPPIGAHAPLPAHASHPLQFLKCGFAGDRAPRHVFHSVVGRPVVTMGDAPTQDAISVRYFPPRKSVLWVKGHGCIARPVDVGAVCSSCAFSPSALLHACTTASQHRLQQPKHACTLNCLH